MNNRYPGARPFTADQQAVFFGRREDITRLSRLIELEQLVVLYGKSGLGKSSLINAGLMPALRETGLYEPLLVRFGAWTEESTESPAQITARYLREDYAGYTLLDKVIPQEGSLWYHAKARRLLGGGDRLVLFFDQFEELFSYPEAQVQAFQEQMAELLRARLPQRYEQMLEVMALQDNALLSDDDEAELLAPLHLKSVLAIRSDRMHLLDRLSAYLPAILRNNYELQALSPEAARQAIVLPAAQEGNFLSPAFTYSDPAIARILDFLKDDAGRVEGIQLQILCQSFEEKVRREGLSQLDTGDIGDLKQIIAYYYRDKITSLGSEAEQLAARRLIEEGLVLEEEQQRLTLHEGQIGALFSVPPGLLQKLVDSHLLRMEPAPRGGYTYELSHDTLVGPVLAAKQKRQEEENRAAEARALEAQRLRLAEEQRKRRRALLFAAFAGVLALAALVAFLWALQQKRSAEASEENARIAREESDQRRVEAEAEKERADSLSLVATLQRDSAQNASALAQQEKLRADAQTRRAQNALSEVQRTSAQIVDNLLEDAVAEIYRLDYEAALEKVYDAAKLQVRAKGSDIADVLSELTYIYAEAGRFDRAWPMLDSTLILSSGQHLSSIDKTDTLGWFRDQIRRFRPQRYAELERRYYPEMMPVKGGTFCMGQLTGACDTSQYPLVTLSDYRIARTETTAWQFSLFAVATGYQMQQPTWGWAGDNPVLNVSWYDAVAYANWLSGQRGFDRVYQLDTIPVDPNDLYGREIAWHRVPNWTADGFRLPTEAEWEYAARGGIQQDTFIYSGSNSLNVVGWYNGNCDENFGVRRTHPVAGKTSNAVGVYDMSGNILEWCWDWSGSYPKKKIVNPTGPKTGDMRVIRGGAWSSHDLNCRVALRNRDVQYDRIEVIGIRLAMY